MKKYLPLFMPGRLSPTTATGGKKSTTAPVPLSFCIILVLAAAP